MEEQSKHELSYSEVKLVFDFMNEMLAECHTPMLYAEEKALMRKVYENCLENEKSYVENRCKKVFEQIENI